MQHLIVLLFVTASCVQAGVRVPRALHFDIEPHVNPKWNTDPAAVATGMVNIYQKIYNAASPLNVPLVADVTLWLATSFVGGNTKSIHERIMPYLDESVVMAYRDWASGTRNIGDGTEGDGQKGGIVGSMTATLALGQQYGVKVTCGIETFCEAEPNWVTFCGRTSTYVETTANQALAQLAAYPAFSGTLAIDNAYSWSILTPSYTLPAATNNRALWQWQGINILNYSDRMNDLFTFATTHAVKVIYFDVLTIFNGNWNNNVRTKFISFLTLCDKYNIDVDLVLGDSTWTESSNFNTAMTFVNRSLDFVQYVRSLDGSVSPSPNEEQLQVQTSQSVKTSAAAARTTAAAAKTTAAAAKTTAAAAKTTAAAQTPAQTTQQAQDTGLCTVVCATAFPGSFCDHGYCECPAGWRWNNLGTACLAPAGATSKATTATTAATTRATTRATTAATTAKTTKTSAAAKTSAPAQTTAAQRIADTCDVNCGDTYPNSICGGGFCICPDNWRWNSNRARCVPPS